MATARARHTATLLPNGRVLVAGGIGASASLTSAAELRDPQTGSFSETGAMGTARESHVAFLRAGGGAVIVGGSSSPVGGPPGVFPFATIEVYR